MTWCFLIYLFIYFLYCTHIPLYSSQITCELGCLYVCTLGCLYVCTLGCLYVCTLGCLYVCTLVCLYVCTLGCLYVCTLVCLYVCTLVCLYVCTLGCLYVCIFKCSVTQALYLSICCDSWIKMYAYDATYKYFFKAITTPIFFLI